MKTAFARLLDVLLVHMRQGYTGELVDHTPNLLHRMRTHRFIAQTTCGHVIKNVERRWAWRTWGWRA